MVKRDAIETKLIRYRKAVDRADKRMIAAMVERQNAIIEIGKVKAAMGIKVLQARRMKEVLKSRVKAGVEHGLNRQYVHRLYSLIHDESVRLQNKLQKRKKK